MNNLRTEVIKYAKKLNSSNLSPLRSGNVSIRAEQDGKEGFFITPSGIKYDLFFSFKYVETISDFSFNL